MANPGWYSDASGRFRLRFHDGVRWTEHIVDDRGRQGTDPVGAGPPTAPTGPVHGSPEQGLRADLPVALAGLGSLLVLLAAFTLAFLGEGGGDGVSLYQLGRIDASFTGWPLAAYAELGRFATLPLSGLCVLVSTRWVGDERQLMRIAAGLAGVLGAWHLVAMFATGQLDTAPAAGAYAGLVGYSGLVAGPWLRHHDLR